MLGNEKSCKENRVGSDAWVRYVFERSYSNKKEHRGALFLMQLLVAVSLTEEGLLAFNGVGAGLVIELQLGIGFYTGAVEIENLGLTGRIAYIHLPALCLIRVARNHNCAERHQAARSCYKKDLFHNNYNWVNRTLCYIPRER